MWINLVKNLFLRIWVGDKGLQEKKEKNAIKKEFKQISVIMSNYM